MPFYIFCLRDIWSRSSADLHPQDGFPHGQGEWKARCIMLKALKHELLKELHDENISSHFPEAFLKMSPEIGKHVMSNFLKDWRFW